MQINRMHLADLGAPDALAEGILKQVPDMPIPVPIEDVARSVDITDITLIGTDSFEGGLVTDRDKSEGVILVNRKSRRQRQRFTIGHELGHFLMPLHLPDNGIQFMCTLADMRRSDSSKTADRSVRVEVEANCFAASMLMPAVLFRRDLARSAVPDIALLLRLCDKYDTSKEATARRFCELTDTPSAAVFSKDGKFLYAVRGREFPFIALRRDQPLAEKSLTARFKGVEGDVSNMAAIDSYWWTDAEPHCNGQILEQALLQVDGYRLTLLQLDEEGIEEGDDEQDLIDAYTPRFRKR